MVVIRVRGQRRRRISVPLKQEKIGASQLEIKKTVNTFHNKNNENTQSRRQKHCSNDRTRRTDMN